MRESSLGSVFIFQKRGIGLDNYKSKESLSRVVVQPQIFGNKSAPRGARPQQDFNVENFDSIVGYNEFNELYKSLPWQYGGKK